MTAFQLRKAARILHSGGILAYPTEAVFGLGCDPLNRQSVQRLLTIKQRSVSKGLILIGAKMAHLQPFMQEVDDSIMRKLQDTWPGPATWLLPAAKSAPSWITGKHDRIALRLIAHPVAADLCQAFGGAIVSTSANLSKRPPAKTPLQVRIRCANQADMIVCAETGRLSSPTSIRDALTGRSIRD